MREYENITDNDLKLVSSLPLYTKVDMRNVSKSSTIKKVDKSGIDILAFKKLLKFIPSNNMKRQNPIA